MAHVVDFSESGASRVPVRGDGRLHLGTVAEGLPMRASEEEPEPTFLAENLYARFRHVFEPFLSEAGIDRAVLTEPDTPVPLARHARLLQLAAERTGDDFLGLHIGQQVHPIDMGALGYALMNAPTVKMALLTFDRYLGAYSRGCEFTLAEAPGGVWHLDFRYTVAVTDLGIVERRHEAECTLSMVLNVVRSLTGNLWSPKRVLFEHPEPEDTSEHRRLFCAPVEFGAAVNRLVIGGAVLERPVRSAQARLFVVIEDHLRRAVAAHAHQTDLLAEVSAIVIRDLANGVPSIDDVAARLAMTKRTLQRRLKDNGVGYAELVEKVRHRLAVEYVSGTRLSLTEIGFLLGYSHPSAFSRAFRKWTGTTPHEYREGPT